MMRSQSFVELSRRIEHLRHLRDVMNDGDLPMKLREHAAGLIEANLMPNEVFELER